LATEYLWYKCNDNELGASQFTAANDEWLEITDAAQLAAGDALSPGDTDYYVCCWIYADTLGTRGIMAKHSGAVEEWLLQVRSDNGGRGRFTVQAIGSAMLPDSSILTGGWYFFEGYHSATDNEVGCCATAASAGTLNSFTTVATSGAASAQGTAPVEIGRYGASTAQDHDGQIQYAGFIGGALPSTADRNELYNAGAGNPWSALSTDLKAKFSAFWNLSEASGTRLDSQSAGYDLSDNGTVTGGPGILGTRVVDSGALGVDGTLQGGNTSAVSTTGKVNEAFDLATADDYVKGNLTPTQLNTFFQSNFSINLWVKVSTVVDTTCTFLYTNDSTASGGGSSFYIDKLGAGGVRFIAKVDNVNYQTRNTTVQLADNTWAMLTAVVDWDNGTKMYFNGTEITYTTHDDITGATPANFDWTSGLSHHNVLGSTGKTTGLVVDDERWFNDILTATEIGYLYNEGAGSESSLADLSPSIPTVSTLSPADDAVDVAVDSNLVITFSEAVDAETGDIRLYKFDDTLVETFDVTTDISGSGTTTITINPTSDLDNNQAYYVQIDATAFDSASNGSYAGIADETTWSFTTVAGASGGGGITSQLTLGSIRLGL
jgi:hypothetical protein